MTYFNMQPVRSDQLPCKSAKGNLANMIIMKQDLEECMEYL